MPELYESDYPTAITPGRRASAVTPNDSTDLPSPAKALIVASVAGGGALQCLPRNNVDGDWVTFDAVVVGMIIPLQVRRVGTGTTCTVLAIED